MHRGIQRKAARSVLPKDQHASLTWPSAHYCGSRHSKVTTIHRYTSQEEQWHNEELHHFLEGLNRKTLQACIGIAARKSGTSKPQPPWHTKMLITTVSRQYQCYRRNFTDTCTHKTEARELPTRLARPQLHVRSTQQPASQQPNSGANEGNTRTPDAARRTRSRSPTTKATQIDTQSIQHEADAMSTEATAAAVPASTTTSHSTPGNPDEAVVQQWTIQDLQGTGDCMNRARAAAHATAKEGRTLTAEAARAEGAELRLGVIQHARTQNKGCKPGLHPMWKSKHGKSALR